LTDNLIIEASSKNKKRLHHETAINGGPDNESQASEWSKNSNPRTLHSDLSANSERFESEIKRHQTSAAAFKHNEG